MGTKQVAARIGTGTSLVLAGLGGHEHAGMGAWPMAARTCVWQGATGAAWTTWLWH